MSDIAGIKAELTAVHQDLGRQPTEALVDYLNIETSIHPISEAVEACTIALAALEHARTSQQNQRAALKHTAAYIEGL